MVKVECDGCRAPYRIDEKRIPATGLKMRCPKCGTSLLVKREGLASAGAAPAPAAATPVDSAPPSTQPEASFADLPAAAGPRKPPPPPPRRAPPPAPPRPPAPAIAASSPDAEPELRRSVSGAFAEVDLA